MQTTNPEAWLADLHKPLVERIAPAAAEVLAYVGLVNRAAGSAVAPRSAPASVDLLADVRGALRALPPVLERRLERPLLGIQLARDLGCSALTDVVRWGDETLGAVVVLDAAALATRRANEWASWKESGPFSAQPGQGPAALQVTIASPAQDRRENAILFLLLHEFGHVLSAESGFLPNWWLQPGQLLPAGHYRFLDHSWQVDAGCSIVPKPGHEFAGRRQLAYYGAPQLGLQQAPALYAALAGTRFASLYGAQNVYDDFAECLALYVHTQLMGRPYRVGLAGCTAALSDSQSVASRCAEKYGFIAQALG
jgi:hypothetical protein